ncbi:hypothetical protein [Thermodesulfobacterium hveragerdense]|uniref:hypothetical protein n=1 Tax=Thermodesulfobacterium hveragerdense TaxID=53424 RepID=UPI00042664E1|nr:hypothetical protein [Thermodesulfobacterium hveragerdense]
MSSRELKEDVKEGEGKDVEMFFSFGEEHREGVFYLGFSFREFFFEFWDEAREGSQLMVRRKRIKELGTLVKRIVSPYKISLQTFASIRIKQT